jgi:hypothetical protein
MARRVGGAKAPGGKGPGGNTPGGTGRAGKHDGGVDMGTGEPSWSNAPGHRKKEAGERSARDFSPGHGAEPPGQIPRNRGENAVDTTEPDSFDREG